MALRLVCFTPDWAVQVWALAGDILLCSWARHFIHIVSPHPVTSCYRNWDKLRPAGLLGSYMHTLPLCPNYENYNWQCMCKVLINFFHIQYCSKVSWQSPCKITPWNSMEFHGKFSMELHGILSGFGTWNSMENFPWNSMEDFPWNSMEFCLGLGHGIPWKSMEVFFLSWNSREFHGIPWNSMEVFLLMEFHRVFSMEFFHGILFGILNIA